MKYSGISFIFFMLALTPTALACFTQEEITVVNSISSSTNVSNSTLLSILSKVCNKTDISNVTQQINNITYNRTELYNRGELYNASEIFIINQSLRNYMINFVAAYNGTIDINVAKFNEILNEKIVSLKGTTPTWNQFNMTFSDYNNTWFEVRNQDYNTITALVERETNPFRMGAWGFASASIAAIVITYIITHKPTGLKPWLTGVRQRRTSLEELVTDTEFRKMQEFQRKLKLDAVRTAPQKYRERIFKKIDDGDIKDIHQLKDEITILKSLEKSESPKENRKGR